MITNLQVISSLLGSSVTWFGDKGRYDGTITAVAFTANGYFQFLILCEGKFHTKNSSDVTLMN